MNQQLNSLCKFCGQEVMWKPNPKDPTKLLPYNLDGSFHPSTCAGRPTALNPDFVNKAKQITQSQPLEKFCPYCGAAKHNHIPENTQKAYLSPSYIEDEDRQPQFNA